MADEEVDRLVDRRRSARPSGSSTTAGGRRAPPASTTTRRSPGRSAAGRRACPSTGSAGTCGHASTSIGNFENTAMPNWPGNAPKPSASSPPPIVPLLLRSKPGRDAGVRRRGEEVGVAGELGEHGDGGGVAVGAGVELVDQQHVGVVDRHDVEHRAQLGAVVGRIVVEGALQVGRQPPGCAAVQAGVERGEANGFAAALLSVSRLAGGHGGQCGDGGKQAECSEHVEQPRTVG